MGHSLPARGCSENALERRHEAWSGGADFQSAHRFQPAPSGAGLNAPRRLKACPTTQAAPLALFLIWGVTGVRATENVKLPWPIPLPDHRLQALFSS
jgi:hypothetical protein